MLHHRLKFSRSAMLVLWPMSFMVRFDCPLPRFIKALWLIHIEWWGGRDLPAPYRDALWLPKVESQLGASELFDIYIAVACTLGVTRHARAQTVRDRYQQVLDTIDARLMLVGIAWALLLMGLDQGFLWDDDYATLQHCLAETVSRRRANRWLDRIERRSADWSAS